MWHSDGCPRRSSFGGPKMDLGLVERVSSSVVFCLVSWFGRGWSVVLYMASSGLISAVTDNRRVLDRLIGIALSMSLVVQRI